MWGGVTVAKRLYKHFLWDKRHARGALARHVTGRGNYAEATCRARTAELIAARRTAGGHADRARDAL